jgi:hypothetical protein
MNAPPKKKKKSPGLQAPGSKLNGQQQAIRHRQGLQAALEQRLDQVVAIGEIMPRVLAITLAQGTTRSGGRYS